MPATDYLQGHKAPVLCLDARSGEHAAGPLLASGADDGVCRLWDVRTLKTVRAFRGLATSVSSVKFSQKADSHRVYIAAGDQIHCFDLRRDALIEDVSAALFSISVTEDVNGIALNGKEDMLAAVDDGGDIRIYDAMMGKSLKRIHGVHGNIAMAIAYRPRHAHEVATGGLDACLVRTDTSRGRPVGEYIIRASDEGAAQMLNPPFVYSVAWEGEGRALVAGCGDGLVRSFHPPSRTSKDRTWIERPWDPQHAHRSAVNTVIIHPGRPRFAISGGNDGIIKGWDGEEGRALSEWSSEPFSKVNALTVDPLVVDKVWAGGPAAGSPAHKGTIGAFLLQ